MPTCPLFYKLLLPLSDMTSSTQVVGFLFHHSGGSSFSHRPWGARNGGYLALRNTAQTNEFVDSVVCWVLICLALFLGGMGWFEGLDLFRGMGWFEIIP